MKPLLSAETLVIGGGVIGMAVAYGLARAGQNVTVLDQGDDVFRAARGNFGLVWVQGKGLNRPEYARWTVGSAKAWPAFATELAALSGVDLELSQIGGLRMGFSDEELAKRAGDMARIRDSIEEAYPFEHLSATEVRERVPHSGPAVAGAIFSPLDGHVSPLRLLRALVQAFANLHGTLRTGETVERLDFREGHFYAETAKATHIASRVVLAAGLGNRLLAPQVGLIAPVDPVRGQVIVTERLQPFLRYPTLHVRQTGEGVIQIGDSKEDVGFDERTTVPELAKMSSDAARYFPLLANVNVVRAWGALRVMTPDGYPIYEESRSCPGAFLVTCHSGITLAAQHAGDIADWIRGVSRPAGIRTFTAERFHVPTAGR